jgi:hypothetical protein
MGLVSLMGNFCGIIHGVQMGFISSKLHVWKVVFKK